MRFLFFVPLPTGAVWNQLSINKYIGSTMSVPKKKAL